MRLILIALGSLVAATAFTAKPSAAQDYGWCAEYRYGATNCGFSSFGQCQAAVRGEGGSCRPSGRGGYYWRRHYRRHHYHY